MYRTMRFFFFYLSIISIVADREKKKICIHNLVINGTNLLTAHRKQLFVVGVTNFNDQSSRSQANRYNDLYRELLRHDIRDSIVSLILVNEQGAETYFPGSHYDKLRLYQDNSKDNLVKKLRHNETTANNFVFGRCGYLLYNQEGSQTDLAIGKNYHDLFRVITMAVKNKRRCQGLCS